MGQEYWTFAMADVNKAKTENMEASDPKSVQDLTVFVQNLVQQMQDKFQTISDQVLVRIDEMGKRVDELEQNIGNLMKQAEMDEPEITLLAKYSHTRNMHLSNA